MGIQGGINAGFGGRDGAEGVTRPPAPLQRPSLAHCDWSDGPPLGSLCLAQLWNVRRSLSNPRQCVVSRLTAEWKGGGGGGEWVHQRHGDSCLGP